MNRSIVAVGLITVTQLSAWAQTNVLPRVYEVYGGTIDVIDAIEVAANKTRVFASTESANSVFYADVDYSNPEPFGTNFMFRVVPDLDVNANFGVPNWIAAHQQSGRIFACMGSGLVSCTVSSGNITTNIDNPMGVSFVLIQDSHLFAVGNLSQLIPGTIYYGTLNTAGDLTLGPSLSTNFSGYDYIKLAINPLNRKLYVLGSPNNGGPVSGTNSPMLFKSSDNYDAFSSGTYFSPVSLTGVTLSSPHGVVLNFGPDGRLFLGGGPNSEADLAWSDDDGGSWTNLATGGGGDANYGLITCNGSSNAYKVYFGTMVSSNKGSAGTWSQAYGGIIKKVDPLNSNVLYYTTDRGLGVSTNAGVDVAELLNGLLAFQIYDIDVLPSKAIAWIGSKYGIRRAVNFNNTPVWTNGYIQVPSVYSVAIDKTDPSGMTGYAGCGYAGQGLVFKTTTGGGTNDSAWRSIFTNAMPDGAAVSIKAGGNFIVFGYFDYSPADNAGGGVYLSHDGGTNWNNVLTNVNVNKLLFLEEDGTGVIYTAASKKIASGRDGIYRIDTNSLTAVLVMTNEVDILDLAADSMGGIYASGHLPGVERRNNTTIVYYLGADSAEWTQLPINGLPGDLSDYKDKITYLPITVGKDSASNDVPVLAGPGTLYYLPHGGSSWETVASYPNGTQVRTLFWDELLVGTSIGLYGQAINAQPVSAVSTPLAADFDGDAKADPALFNTNGTWKIKLSSGGYTLLTLTGFLGGSGYSAVTADFDGDGKADPAIYNAALELWAVKLSSINYLAPTVLTSFGGSGWQALAGDFDGDRLADPALYNTNPSTGSGQAGTWQVKLSTAGYATITSTGLLGYAGWTAIAADFDGDGKVDPAIYKASSGSWIVILSTMNYGTAIIDPWFLGSAGYIGMGADFDGDGYADPAVAQTSTGNWKLRLSSSGYGLLDLPGFLGE